MSTVKTKRLPKNLVRAVARWAKLEKVDESTAMRQLLAMGVEEFAVKFYKDGKMTLNAAAELTDVSTREMIDILLSHGIRGNITLDQQRKAIEFARE
jgi:hypothetical protein